MRYLLIRTLFTTILFFALETQQVLAAGLTYTCNLVTPATVAFGNINTNDALPETIVADISVFCTASEDTTVNYTVTFGTGGSGNSSNRITTNSNLISTLKYNIYKDAAYLQILADGQGGTKNFSTNYNLKKNTSKTDRFTIYGLMPVQTSTASGSYLDNIIVTITTK